MIKSYLELDKDEIIKVYDFINRKEKSNNENILDNMFKIKIYNYGEGVFFYFKNNIVVGKVCVVLKEVLKLGTAYIHNIEVLESELKKKKQY